MTQPQFDFSVCDTPQGLWIYRNFESVGKRLTLESAADAIHRFDPSCLGFYYVKGPDTRRYRFVDGNAVQEAK